MQKLIYTVSFNTPAFLGNAEQAGQWRTPPFKALLRQWWRVVYAAENKFRVNVDEMRKAESLLFGVAADGGDSMKSQVRIRLDSWNLGSITSWDGVEMPKIPHPEVERAQRQVGPQAYLGFGPLDGRGGTTLTKAKAIATSERVHLRVGVVDAKDALTIEKAATLIHQFGSIGGRSRNGWGSIALDATGEHDAYPLRPWEQALAVDWAHCIGQSADGRPLIWATDPKADWRAAMVDLAKIKIAVRTQNAFRFLRTPGDGQVHDRHWLSYPVTNHSVHAWGDARLPNSLRFKVRKAGNQFVGVVFHMPCKPPPELASDQTTLQRIWAQVHLTLDNQTTLKRSAS